MSKSFLSADHLLKQTFLSKAVGRVWTRKYQWKAGKCNCTNHVNIEPLKIDYYSCEESREICKKYLRHQFNFLGTGWICWNAKNIPAGTADGYETIAWDRDILSAYQFTQEYLSPELIPSLPKGVDIKRPWELGRLNHFPFMALCALNNTDLQAGVLKEFVAQVADLIGHNHVGRGVQYYCPMDVAIRCINILFSYDIFRQIDKDGIISEAFSDKIEHYLLAQGKYISQNLEYNFAERTGGNHLLCDLCGLLWICAYFSEAAGVHWYQGCKKLFFKEVKKQFLPGGSNYECSSGYHRLSSEMVAMGLVAIEWVDGRLDSDDSVCRRIKGMTELLKILRGRDGNMIQIGDMDSGFILKLVPQYAGDQENTLSVDYVLGLTEGLISRSSAIDFSIGSYVAQQLLEGFSIKGFELEGEKGQITGEDYLDAQDIDGYERFMEEAAFVKQHNFRIENSGAIIKIISNTEFGMIKVIYEHVDLYIRIMPDYSRMDMAHAHDDVFHYEAVYFDCRKNPDSGSVTYTADTETRNFYAGNQSHNTAIHKIPVVSRSGVFSASSMFQGRTGRRGNDIYLCADGSYKHIRKFMLYPLLVTIIDASDEEFKINVKDASYSLGYGQVPTIHWRFWGC